MVNRQKIFMGGAFVFIAVFFPVLAFQLGSLPGIWDIGLREPGYVTYAVDCRLGQAAVDGAHDAFDAWDEANWNIVLEESSSWSEADVRVARMYEVLPGIRLANGCACIGVSPLCPLTDNVVPGLFCHIPNGGTIGVFTGLHYMNGTFVPYSRDMMRDLIAHEFGHNLGMSHDTVNMSHMMYGEHALYPHSDRGYVIPEPIAGDDTIPAASADEVATASCVMP